MRKNMTKQTSKMIAFSSVAALAAGLSGCCWVAKFCRDKIIIINQPQNQTVHISSNASFSVLAVKGPPYSTNGLSYQWQFNGAQLSRNLFWTNVPGATNSSFTIPSAQITNVAFYRVLLSGSSHVISDPASLQVFTVDRITSTITVYGTPVVSSSHGT